MKTIRKIYIMFTSLLALTACGTLDLNPLSDGSSETWNSTPEEIEMSLNGLYKDAFWPMDQDTWTDDFTYRDATNVITAATINGETDFVKTNWLNTYKCIARANDVLESVDRAAGVLSEDQIGMYKAEAQFVRAAQYSYLLSHYGHVVYSDKVIDLDEAASMKQSDPAIVLANIYADFDVAAQKLKTQPASTDLKRATAGAALAMKARIALYMNDWATARDAAKACMDLGIYKLHPDFANLFLSKTKNSVETIFGFPRSITLKIVKGDIQNYVSRTAGGWAANIPTWDLFCSFLCNDGLPIDESPKFDPHKPFQNRDPRCAVTITAFQTPHLGYIYEPHPDSVSILRLSDNKRVQNQDTRSVAQYASYNGLVWNKGVDNDWLLNSWRIEPDKIIIRYADVLLIYAEAKIELGELDQSVLDAINQVRARAYGVDYTNVAAYPAVAFGSQTAMRKIIRAERRQEFALEGIRYMDLIRWHLAGKVLNKPTYGLLDPADLKAKVTSKGLWFFPSTPAIDDDGVVDFSPLYNAGLIKQLSVRKFDESRQYLWPIPTTEVLTSHLEQNPNY